MMYIIGLIIICLTVIICNNNNKRKCCHIWREQDNRNVVVTIDNEEYYQDVQTNVCVNCGKIVQINLTSGESKVLAEGGRLQKNKGI